MREHDSFAAGEKGKTEPWTGGDKGPSQGLINLVEEKSALEEEVEEQRAALAYAGESAVRMAARLQATRDLLRSIVQLDCICGECERIRAELARGI